MEQLPESWQARGRMAIKDPASSGSFRFNWLQLDKHFRVEVSGPLGIGATVLESLPGRRLRLTDAQGNVQEAKLTGSLMTRALGWRFPLSALPFWLSGRPAPGLRRARPLPETEGFEQSGWQLIPSRSASVRGLSLPRKLLVKKGDTELRIAIHDWNLSVSPQSAPFASTPPP